MENKSTERSFNEWSAWKCKGRSRRWGSPDSNRCSHPLQVVKDQANRCPGSLRREVL